MSPATHFPNQNQKIMKPLNKSIWSIIAVSTSLVVSAAAFNLRSSETLDAKRDEAAVTALTSKILESSQFAHQRLDDELAGKFLDRYLDALDGGHLLFLQSDVNEFARSGPDSRGHAPSGDSSPANIIFARYSSSGSTNAPRSPRNCWKREIRFHRRRAIQLRPQERAASADIARLRPSGGSNCA